MDRRPVLDTVSRCAAVLAFVLLVAAAFFLPEWLSGLHDRQLLDNPTIEIQEEDQEGFAEAIQLTVAEKLVLIRSGSLMVTELSREQEGGVYLISGAGDEELVSIAEEELQDYNDTLSQVWEPRLTAVRTEIRNLQILGGLPALWREDGELSYDGLSEQLYMDPDTRMNFLVYRMTLLCDAYRLEVSVDAQSGRILSFGLWWNGTDRWPGWGFQGASNFGDAWRNYWGMDSVGSGWYNEYNRSILELAPGGGDRDAHGHISFTYDGQIILIPLDGWSYSGRTNFLSWNF